MIISPPNLDCPYFARTWLTIFTSVSDPGFPPDPDQSFFLNPDPDRPKIRIRSGKIPIRIREKNVLKLELKKYYISYLALLTLSFMVRLLQKHHLDPVSLFMDGSGLLKPGSGSAKKPGSIRIRIRNTGFYLEYRPRVQGLLRHWPAARPADSDPRHQPGTPAHAGTHRISEHPPGIFNSGVVCADPTWIRLYSGTLWIRINNTDPHRYK